MKERESANISIMRGSDVFLSVLITRESKRVFRLMEEDCIELSFSLGEAVAFMVGDYCDDELFGRFVVTEEQMPAYNQGTGGYDYTLRMEAPYMALRNKVHAMPSDLTSTGGMVRKETHWTLTEALLSHAKAVVDNARLSGVDCFLDNDGEVFPGADGYPVVVAAASALERKCVTYGGVSVLSALGMIADAFETEWWVSGGVLHFGKCEGLGDPYVFRLGWNVERMDVRNDLQDYCNAIFAFGGTENVPESYRKELRFVVTDAYTVGSERLFVDRNHRVTIGMLHGGGLEMAFSNPWTTSSDAQSFTALLDGTLELPYASVCAFSGSLMFGARLAGSARGTVRMRLMAYPFGGTAVEIASATDAAGEGPVRMQLPVDVALELPRGGYTLRLLCDVGVEAGSEGTLEFVASRSLAGGTVSVTAEAQSCGCMLLYGGVVHEVTFNPHGAESGEEDYYRFGFVAGAPQGFVVGSEYTLLFYGERYGGVTIERGLEVTEVPLSWFQSVYDDPSSLWSIGERRLMLPVGAADERYTVEGSRVSVPGLSPMQVVERTVLFEGIHPQCVLVVTGVERERKRTREEHQDGSATAWQWTEYRIKCRTIEGGDFPFKSRYVKAVRLRARFMTPDDADTTAEDIQSDFSLPDLPAFRLAGMTFDVGFNSATQEYTLVRNEDYGAMLPNETLCPGLGDLFTLTGWDVRAMASLGLVEVAEEELLAKAVDYLDAMEDGQFVFTCEMMSDWLFHTEDGWADLLSREELSQAGSLRTLPFNDSDERRVRVWHVMPIPFLSVDGTAHQPLVSGGRQFWVRNGYYWFLLPLEGARVTVVHDGLKNGEKTSRIIGYEFKLDKPYDTPRYTVGETEAYSRLRQLEKEMTKK